MAANGGRDRGPQKQTRLPAATRRKMILDAALQIFSEHGAGAPIGDVASAAGVSRTVLYYYFETKQELALAVLESQAESLLHRLAPLVSVDAPAVERARSLLEAAVRFADEEPRGWDLLFRPGSDEPEIESARAAVFEAAKSSFLDLVRPELGGRAVDPDDLVVQVAVEGGLAALRAIVQWWRSHPEVPCGELVDATFEYFWAGLAGIIVGPPVPARGRPLRSPG